MLNFSQSVSSDSIIVFNLLKLSRVVYNKVESYNERKRTKKSLDLKNDIVHFSKKV